MLKYMELNELFKAPYIKIKGLEIGFILSALLTKVGNFRRIVIQNF